MLRSCRSPRACSSDSSASRIGLGFGVALLRWILDSIFPAAVPDLAVLQAITPSSYLLTVAIGLGAAAIAPLLNVRRLRAMNIPSTLRYVE